jgi:hypothetical protein
MVRNKLFFTFALLCLWLPSAAAQDNQPFKQLAGPAEEISSMRLPAPETLGQRSKAVMLPIRNQDNSGQWRAEIPVDDPRDLKLTLFAPHSTNWTISLAAPDGSAVNLRTDAAARGISRQLTAVSFEGDTFPAEVYTLEEAQPGLWTVEIDFPKGLGAKAAGYLVVSSLSKYRLYSYLNTAKTIANNDIGFVASLFDQDANAESGAPRLMGGLQSAQVVIQDPAGQTVALPMYDDGLHQDGAAGDGVWGGNFRPELPGRYLAQLLAQGHTPEGAPFMRSSEHLFQVAAQDAKLGRIAGATPLDTLRVSLNVPVQRLKKGQKVIGYAEVWGHSRDGSQEPVAWVGGLAYLQQQSKRGGLAAPFTLDTRWLALRRKFDNYELRNVRLQDPDYFVTLGEADAIAIPALPETNAGTTALRLITEDMRTGPRPPQAVNAPGGKLMLIHGYCSGSNPWPASQFANAVVFNDLNQNRTHDQFANLIRNFGASLPSFGAVAHSQGGAASLHLYTYYWSGLDNATGARLIQSVGTPYQGTALAGNLALLGQIFGAGCGSNTNLTYSGAAAWLAGIPTWARAKVHYFTTSFTDVWWRYDYCNLATDPFLSDPEDGVVERAYGQLSGANNRGHKTGWCHTSGMRDPAQTSDSSRNADMNTNAAR